MWLCITIVILFVVGFLNQIVFFPTGFEGMVVALPLHQLWHNVLNTLGFAVPWTELFVQKLSFLHNSLVRGNKLVMCCLVYFISPWLFDSAICATAEHLEVQEFYSFQATKVNCVNSSSIGFRILCHQWLTSSLSYLWFNPVWYSLKTVWHQTVVTELLQKSDWEAGGLL